MEIMNCEKTYYESLNKKLQALYTASSGELNELLKYNNRHVAQYVAIAKVNCEIQTMHESYNVLLESDTLDDAAEAAFSCVLAAGTAAATLQLSNMDVCDSLYYAIANARMSLLDTALDFCEQFAADYL